MTRFIYFNLIYHNTGEKGIRRSLSKMAARILPRIHFVLYNRTAKRSENDKCALHGIEVCCRSAENI